MLTNERFIALSSLMTVHGVGAFPIPVTFPLPFCVLTVPVNYVSRHLPGHHRAKELYVQGYRSAEDLRKTGQWDKEFRYHDDIQLKIPRSEVESIHEFVRIQLDRIEPGAHSVLCGG